MDNILIQTTPVLTLTSDFLILHLKFSHMFLDLPDGLFSFQVFRLNFFPNAEDYINIKIFLFYVLNSPSCCYNMEYVRAPQIPSPRGGGRETEASMKVFVLSRQ
jgi:hypothetical protein